VLTPPRRAAATATSRRRTARTRALTADATAGSSATRTPARSEPLVRTRCGVLTRSLQGVPPASLAEFTLSASSGLDYYDVSLVRPSRALTTATDTARSPRSTATTCPSASQTTRAAGPRTAPSTSARTARRRSRARSTAAASPSAARARASSTPTRRTAPRAARARTPRPRRARRPACRTTGARGRGGGVAQARLTRAQLLQAELPERVRVRVRRGVAERALHVCVEQEGKLQGHVLPVSET
jgi:hypothetical protein